MLRRASPSGRPNRGKRRAEPAALFRSSIACLQARARTACCRAETGLAAAVTLTSVAAGGPSATKQRVAINVKFHASTFVLSPLGAGALKRDSGTMSELVHASCHDVIREGQQIGICTGNRWTLTGKQGTLTIRTHAEWVDPGSGGCGAAHGTWKVTRGTGNYAGISGGGRSAYDAHCSKWYARHEGFLALP